MFQNYFFYGEFKNEKKKGNKIFTCLSWDLNRGFQNGLIDERCYHSENEQPVTIV